METILNEVIRVNDKVKTFFKEKGFYISLLVGVIAILAVGIISANVLTGENEGAPQVAEKEPEAALIEEPNETELAKAETPQTPVPEKKETQTEDLSSSKTEEKDTKEKKAEDAKAADEEETAQEAEPETAQVISQSEKLSNLTFDEEKGLLWPVSGDVLLPFSIEKSIYFETLAQYKINPAVLIAGKEDMEVFSAYNGVITAIEENEETGLTVTASIGDGYELVYGNLKDVEWKEGDFIAEGTRLGLLSAPTKYYVKEGANLYFKVLENEEAVDPILVLR